MIGWIGLIAGFVSAISLLTGNYLAARVAFGVAVICVIAEYFSRR
jgi:hypothetical protein